MNPLYLEVAVVILGIILLMAEAFAGAGNKRGIAYAAIAGLLAVLAATFIADPAAISAAAPYAKFYRADFLAIFLKQFALLSTVIVLVMSLEYAPTIEATMPSERRGAGLGEFFALPILACAGLMWMASAVDFVMIFVSLELVTITFYILVSYMRRSAASLEAGAKYLVLGALSTGFLVYGITWIYGVTGQTNLAAIAATLPALDSAVVPALLFGFGLVLVALGFKVAAAPFQFWVPDVYQGAPTPVSAFLSVASKAAGFVVLLRVIQTFVSVPELQAKIIPAISLLAGATMIFGNLAAIPQSNLKRLLAYSSIGHAGYLLIGVASIGAPFAGTAILFYLGAYLLMTLLAFLVMTVVAQSAGGDDLSDFAGLNQRAPQLAFAMLLAMLSLAGLPLTVGFLGKLFIFECAVQQQHYILVALGVIAVSAGFYFYLKVIRAMYWQQPADPDAPEIKTGPLAKFTIAALCALIIWLGVYPAPLLALIR
ncbi:MAG: NADH-quinone oxidoreductase subunit N [Chthoniobacterales bacterium]|nr:NADH-quinone oxidoreductase subunit N [Chthoniobacterales bacterium]